ncbi:MAG: SusC/RagA family TonB-linked outer membrane protein [Chitinophagaceae bacterium]|nr:MAG: SusC/RagA family TonB-linked outer membrane protein [Chitinophagaceae bacterium]
MKCISNGKAIDKKILCYVTQQIWKIMKLVMFLLTVSALQVSARGFGQTITFHSEKKITVEEALNNVTKQVGYSFIGEKDVLANAPMIILSLNKVSLTEALNQCLKGLPLVFEVEGKIVVLKRKGKPIKEIKEAVNNSSSGIADTVIRGRVTNNTGTPLVGVTISLKGTSIGTISDLNGDYSLDAGGRTGTLIFSYVGYEKKEIAIEGHSIINIQMSSGVSSLSQLVVTALGIKRDIRSLTSASQTVNIERLKKSDEPNIMTALQGEVAGMSITLDGMEIGGAARVVLRGDKSISGDSQPLYVIDGVPTMGDISNLSMNDIASINVLKGPSAAALYGSSAQNGVVVITTKSGVAGVNSISVNSNFSWSTPGELYPFQNEYGQGTNGIYDAHSDLSWGPKMNGQMVDNWSLDPKDKGKQYAFTPQPNNIKDFFRIGKLWTNSVNITKGGSNTQIAFSYTNVYGEGISPNNSLKRNNILLRITSGLLSKNDNSPLKLDSKIGFTNEQRVGKVQQGIDGLAESIYTIPRNLQLSQMKDFQFVDSTGASRQNYWVPQSIWDQNPYWRAYRDVNSNLAKRVLGLLSLNYDFTSNFNLLVRGSYDGEFNDGEAKLYNDTYNRAQFGMYSVNHTDSYLLNTDFLLSYKRLYSNKWKIDINGGGSIVRNSSKGYNVNTGQGLAIPNLFTLTNSLLPVVSSQTSIQQVTQSLYAFGNFSYKNDIFLDISGRNDWSSTLPPGHLSYFYPSIGLSAIISDLIPAFPSWISLLKIETSASQVGNGAQPYMLTRNITFVPGGMNGFIMLNNTLPDKNLKPEITKSYEAGLNIGFFNNRLVGDFTVYKSNTFNQLFTLALPIGSGASSLYTNGGNIQNKGIEAILSARIIQSKNLTWNLDINFSANRNMVLKINDQRPKVLVGNITIEQGQPFGVIYGRGFLRDSAGNIIVNSNGIPEHTSDKSVRVANFNPDWLGSISNTFSYKNFSLSFLIDHRQGGTMLSLMDSRLYGDGQAEGTLQGRDGGLIFGKNFFSNERAVLENGKVNDIPITSQQFWESVGGRNDIVEEAFKVSATNTRLRSLTISYSLPISNPQTVIRNIEFSLYGRNLFFIQRASKTVDPDLTVGTGVGNEGISNFTLPTIRTFGLSIKADF